MIGRRRDEESKRRDEDGQESRSATYRGTQHSQYESEERKETRTTTDDGR